MDKPGTAWYLPADFAANRPVILSKVQLEADRLKALLDSRERISDDDRKLLQRGLRALERLTEVLGNREADIQSQKFLESLIEPISVLGLVLTNLGAHDSEYGEFRAASPQCDWENEQDF
jgi:hypothetical protein